MPDITYMKSRIKEVADTEHRDVEYVREKDNNLYVMIRGMKESIEIKDAFDEYNRPKIGDISYRLAEELVKERTSYASWESTDTRLEIYGLHEKFIEILSGKKPSKLEKITEEEKERPAVPATATAVATILFLASLSCFALTKKAITTYAVLGNEIKMPSISIIASILLLVAALFFLFSGKKNKKLENFCRREYKRIYKKEPNEKELEKFIENVKKAAEKKIER